MESRFEITFIDPDFPSRWQAKFGLCDQNPTIVLNETPVGNFFMKFKDVAF